MEKLLTRNSIPGYVFSEKPDHPGFGTAKTAQIFDKLMKRLGYHHYGLYNTPLLT